MSQLRKRTNVVATTNKDLGSTLGPLPKEEVDDLKSWIFAQCCSIPFPLVIFLFSWGLVHANYGSMPRIPFLLFTHQFLIFATAPLKNNKVHAIFKVILAVSFQLAGIHNVAISHVNNSMYTTSRTLSHITHEKVRIPAFLAFVERSSVQGSVAECVFDPILPCYARFLNSGNHAFVLSSEYTGQGDTMLLSAFLSSTTFSIPIPSVALFGLLGNIDKFQFFTMLGLALSFLGDVFLLKGRQEMFFLGGLVAFLLGHVGYLVGNLQHLTDITVPLLIQMKTVYVSLFVAMFCFGALIWLTTKGNLKGIMAIAVPVYIVVITSMMMSSCIAAFITPVTPVNAVWTQSPDTPVHAKDQPPYMHIEPECYPQYKQYTIDNQHTSQMYPAIHHFANQFSTITHDQTEDKCKVKHSWVPEYSWQTFFSVIGATLFAISDLFVANEKFVKHSILNRVIGLALYFYAQILISTSLRY